MNNDYNKKEQERIDDIFNFLDSETKKLRRKNKIQGFKQYIIKLFKKAVKFIKPERVFIHRTFKRALYKIKIYRFKYKYLIHMRRARRDVLWYLFIAAAIAMQSYHAIT